MAEDEDVDIIGDLDDIYKISSEQLLSCEYTVHPNWLNENSDGGSFWTNSVPKNYSLENNIKVLQSEEFIVKEPEHVPCLPDLDWKKEMPMENDLVFGNDIPATVEEIVDGGNNCIDTLSSILACSEKDDYISDGWNLAAFEVHPAPRNVKYIGPTNPRSLLKVNIESNEPRREDKVMLSGGHGISNIIKKPIKKFKKTLRLKSESLVKPENWNIPSSSKNSEYDIHKKKNGKKFRKTLNISASTIRKDIFRSKNSKTSVGNGEKLSFKLAKKTSLNTIAGRQIKQFYWPETVVKLQTCESDGDVEIEIENEICNDKMYHTIKESKNVVSNEQGFEVDKLSQSESIIRKQHSSDNLSSELEKQLRTMTVPQAEVNLNPTEITSLEKYVHSEFFENRITKTSERYFRIRNHILLMWKASKPNYISKTAVRAGLKHAGDVNCISRIHKLLEQLGAINFGHQGEYFEFIRPLELFVSTLAQSPRNQTKSFLWREDLVRMERRKRLPTPLKTINDTMSDDINYTVTHIDGVFKPELPTHDTSRRRVSRLKTPMDLVKCLKFSHKCRAPFKVVINLSTLLCLHLHSLSSSYEVMGLLGGHRSISGGRDKLHLTTYKPCRTWKQSIIMCEMCPVSQVKQSVRLFSEGYELLGWFHSHPVFPANPSRTDVESQKEMQLQFSIDNNRPLVGVILSCVKMTLRCIYIMPKDLHSDVSNYGLPHELDVDVIKDCTRLQNDVKDILAIIENYVSFTDIIKKFRITSRKLLEKYGLDDNIVLNEILSK